MTQYLYLEELSSHVLISESHNEVRLFMKSSGHSVQEWECCFQNTNPKNGKVQETILGVPQVLDLVSSQSVEYPNPRLLFIIIIEIHIIDQKNYHS